MCAVGGCDSGASKSDDGTTAAAPGAGGEQPAASKKKKLEKRAKKDRGQASVKIGDRLWDSKSANAKVGKSGDTLHIDISRSDFKGKKASREQFKLVLRDYKGPGTYQASSGSVFLGVGLDQDELEAATTDEKATDVVTKAVTKSKMIMLLKTTVVVESADDKQVVGTFSQPAIAKYPAITDGTFRAILKK
jgi:hypothetical protein